MFNETKISLNISQGNREQIDKLSSVDSLLKKLQFLFKLPNKLKSQIQENNYEQVSKYIIQRRERDNQHVKVPLNLGKKYLYIESYNHNIMWVIPIGWFFFYQHLRAYLVTYLLLSHRSTIQPKLLNQA